MVGHVVEWRGIAYGLDVTRHGERDEPGRAQTIRDRTHGK